MLKASSMPTADEFRERVTEVVKKKKGRPKTAKKAGKTKRGDYLDPNEDFIKQQIDILRYMRYIFSMRENRNIKIVEHVESESEEQSEEEPEEEIE